MLQCLVAALALASGRAFVGRGIAVRGASTVPAAKKKKAKAKQELKRAELPAGAVRPKLIVFDLDNTLWQPELYQMRGKKPKANKDIKLTAGALDALHDLAGDGWEKTQAAVASRATATDWAEKLLQDFKLDHGQSIATLLPFREIYEGNKRKHLQRIREASGVPYSDMIFFDDYTENLGDAAHLGVMGVHCPRGLTHEHWEGGLRAYARLKAQDTSFMGRMFTPVWKSKFGRPRHRRDVVSVAASARWRGGSRRSILHWLISAQVHAARPARGGLAVPMPRRRRAGDCCLLDAVDATPGRF